MLPAQSVADLLRMARAATGKLSFASAGLADLGVQPVSSSGAQFRQFIQAETGKWPRS